MTPHPVLGAHSSSGPVLVTSGLSDTPSLRRSQAVLAALPLEDNSCSFLSLPVLQAEHLQLFSQASPCFPAHSSIPSSLPGPELALDTDINLMSQPCGSTVCGDNRQESKMVSCQGKEAHLLCGAFCQVEQANWLDFVEHRTWLKTDIPRQTDEPQGWCLARGAHI